MNQCCDFADCPWNKYLLLVTLEGLLFCLPTLNTYCICLQWFECKLNDYCICLTQFNNYYLCIPQFQFPLNAPCIFLPYINTNFLPLLQLEFHLNAYCLCLPKLNAYCIFYSKFSSVSSQPVNIICPQEQFFILFLVLLGILCGIFTFNLHC